MVTLWRNHVIRARVTLQGENRNIFDLGFPALASTLERDSNPQPKRSFVKGWGRTRLVPSGESQIPLPHSSARGVCDEEKTIDRGQEYGRAALRADERGNAVGSKCAFRLGFASHRAASRSGIGGDRTSHVRIAVGYDGRTLKRGWERKNESKATTGDARERRVEIPTCICTQRGGVARGGMQEKEGMGCKSD